MGEDAMSKMPMADQPEGLISTLLPYQRQGLAWMLEKENPVLPAPGSTDVVQLWKRSPNRPNVFQNIATQFCTSTAPVLARGGILADDMGVSHLLLWPLLLRLLFIASLFHRTLMSTPIDTNSITLAR